MIAFSRAQVRICSIALRGAILAAMAFAFGCVGSEQIDGPAGERPRWLQALVDDVLGAAVTNPPTRILAFEYRGALVYYRPPHCCDVPGVVFDEQGNVVCHPDGGLTGHGDGLCPDFFAARRGCAVVWRDPRAKATSTDSCDLAATPRSSDR